MRKAANPAKFFFKDPPFWNGTKKHRFIKLCTCSSARDWFFCSSSQGIAAELQARLRIDLQVRSWCTSKGARDCTRNVKRLIGVIFCMFSHLVIIYVLDNSILNQYWFEWAEAFIKPGRGLWDGGIAMHNACTFRNPSTWNGPCALAHVSYCYLLFLNHASAYLQAETNNPTSSSGVKVSWIW